MTLVEDSPEYALLVREMLASATDGPLEIAHFESMNAAAAATCATSRWTAC